MLIWRAVNWTAGPSRLTSSTIDSGDQEKTRLTAATTSPDRERTGAAIDRSALLQIAAVSSVIVLVIAALYRPLAVGAFDPVFLRAVGVRAPYGALFSTLVVAALVASFQAFGTLLAVGPMLLPAAAARCWGIGAAASIALTTGFGIAASVAGLLVSYHVNLPSGPAIVLAAGLLFGISLALASALSRLAPMIRRGA